MEQGHVLSGVKQVAADEEMRQDPKCRILWPRGWTSVWEVRGEAESVKARD